jgi:uncharacterized membrane protein
LNSVISSMPAKARIANGAVVSIHALLAITVLVWRIGLHPVLSDVVWALLLCIPLALPTYGLWQGKRYTHAWATLCVIPYFIVGVTESVADPAQRVWAAISLALALLLFTALIAYLRLSTPPTPTDIENI